MPDRIRCRRMARLAKAGGIELIISTLFNAVFFVKLALHIDGADLGCAGGGKGDADVPAWTVTDDGRLAMREA
jgi:hypothetical protein